MCSSFQEQYNCSRDYFDFGRWSVSPCLCHKGEGVCRSSPLMMNSIRNKITLYSGYWRGVHGGKGRWYSWLHLDFSDHIWKVFDKTSVGIRGKRNSTLVHTFCVLWCWVRTKTSPASVGHAGTVRNLSSIFCAVLLPLHSRVLDAPPVLLLRVSLCSVTTHKWHLFGKNPKLDQLPSALFFYPMSRHSCHLIPFYICSLECLTPSLFFCFRTS